MNALALFSGGLDSTLAVHLVKEQGVEVVALHFTGPFTCGEPEGGLSRVLGLADKLAVRLIVHRLDQDFLDVVMSPRFGYGKGLNPCIDCRIYELRLAHRYMQQEGAAFLITGEVVGQRPMSQRLPTLHKIETEAGVKGLVLRPLSAHQLPETVPEKMRWVSRESLLGIKGRGRKLQLDLAKKFDIHGYASPAGGCLLTLKEFARKAEDLLDHNQILTERQIELLRSGRVFRLDAETRVIVGRNQADNRALMSLADDDIQLRPVSVPGPTALVVDRWSERAVEVSAAIVARYSDHNNEGSVTIEVSQSGSRREISVDPLDPRAVDEMRV